MAMFFGLATIGLLAGVLAQLGRLQPRCVRCARSCVNAVERAGRVRGIGG